MSQTINVDITPNNFQPTLNYSQGDVGRTFSIKIVSQFGDTLPSGATVKIQATKPSGFGFDVTADSVTDNVATFTTTAEMTDEWGRFPAQLDVTKDAVTIFSAKFLMVGAKNTHPEGTADGSQGTIIPELTLLVERVEAAASSVLDMEVEAQTLPAGSLATYSYDEDENKATFGIPQGEAGAGAAGVTASAYSASRTYAVGEYVIHNNNLYRCTTAITTAEAFTAAHWTQVVLGDDVTDLKADLKSSLISSIIPDWENGTFSSTDGSDVSQSGRIREDALLGASLGDSFVDANNDLVFLLFAWTLDGTFVGSRKTGAVFDKTLANFEYVDHFDFADFPNYKFKMTLKNNVGNPISTSDGTSIVIYKSVTDLQNQIEDVKADLTIAESNIDTLETHKVAQPLDEHNQPTDGTDGQLLRTKGDGSTEWVDEGLPTDEQTAQAVSDWLEEHPEATTTVQDGSLTEPKFSDALKLKTIKDYVTPQMFGALGNGVADDTTAICDAIRYCKTNNVNRLHFPVGTYNITGPVFQLSNIEPFLQGFVVTGDGRARSVIKLITDGAENWIYDSSIGEKYIGLSFYEIGFTTDNASYGNGFKIYSLGNEKQLRFSCCSFNLGTIASFVGNVNADIHQFYCCSFRAKKTAFILNNPQSVGTSIIGCNGYFEGDFLDSLNGGCFNVIGCTFDFFGSDSNYAIFFGDATDLGSGNLNINIIATRFELHNGTKLVGCGTGYGHGAVSFSDCNIGTVEAPQTGAVVHAKSNKFVRFTRCVFNDNVNFISESSATSNGSSPSGALIKIENCLSGSPIWKRCTIVGDAGRIVGYGNGSIVAAGNQSAQDFDFNYKQRAYEAENIRKKVLNMSWNGVGLPVSGAQRTFNLPPNAYITKIYIYRAASGDYQNVDFTLYVGSADKTVILGQSANTKFNQEIKIEVDYPGVIAGNKISMWATGEATQVTGTGYAFVEYI